MSVHRIIYAVATNSIPEQGQLVEVRRRQWVVADLMTSALPAPEAVSSMSKNEHLLTLSSIEEDALGEEMQVVWEIEPGARILEKAWFRLTPDKKAIQITDDGHGMTEKDVNEKFLLVCYRHSDRPNHHRTFRPA